MKLKLSISLAAALLASVAFFLPIPDSHADPEAAEACLEPMVGGAIASGYRVRGRDTYKADDKTAVTYRVTLYKGMSYLLLGCADGQGVDLDMRLYDAAGELVSNDKSPDAVPFVDVEPTKTGEYALQVLVYKSDQPSTDFAVAIAYSF